MPFPYMLKDIATLYIALCLLMVKVFQNSPTTLSIMSEKPLLSTNTFSDILSIMSEKPLLSTNTLSAVKLIGGLLNEEASLRKEQSSLTFDLKRVVSSVVCMAINSSVCSHFCCDNNCGIQLKRWQVILLVTNNLLFLRFSPARNIHLIHGISTHTALALQPSHTAIVCMSLLCPAQFIFLNCPYYAQRYASCPYYAQRYA